MEADLPLRARGEPLFEPTHESDEAIVDAREERGVGLLQHRAVPVERGVRERRPLTEEELLLCQGAERRLEQPLGTLDERVAIAMPRVDAAGAELALFHEHVEAALERALPRVTNGRRSDAEEHVLQRTVDEVAVGPDRTLERRRHEPGAFLLLDETL